MKSDIKVSVCVVTYNQEKYIAECLQSLVDQQCDFKFEIIVGEDCSTDGTRDIVDKFAEVYPELIVKNYHEANVGATENVLSTYKIAKGEYICHIDGDDLALPDKLKEQARYLDENSNCNIVWSRMQILDQSTGRLYDDLISDEIVLKKIYYQADIILHGSIACQSSKMFRKNTLEYIQKPEGEIYDVLIDVEQLKEGYGKIMPSILGVYRSGVGISSATGVGDIYISNMEYLSNKYPNYHSEFSVKFFVLFLQRLKRFNFDYALLRLAISNASFSTPKKLITFLKLTNYFRSPI